jgi:hypothetical protein
MPLFFLYCMHCCRLLSRYLAPLGYGLDLLGSDARILEVALVPSLRRGKPYWGPRARPRPGVLNSAPIRSASWYFLSFDSRNKTDNRAVGCVLVFVVLDHAAIRPLTTPSPNCRVWLLNLDVAIPAREGDSPVVVIMVVILEVKSTKKTALWVGPLPCNRIYMRAGQQTGVSRADPRICF